MKALITGGAGFIGSHLTDLLLSNGHDVVVVDDLSTGSLENLDGVRTNTRFRFVHENVCDSTVMKRLVDKCEVVFHLAAAVGVQLIVDKPVHTLETNIHGCEVVLEAASRSNKKIIIASSSEVYGKSMCVPFYEDDDMVLGSTRFSRWSYACSKAIDEFLGLAYHRKCNLPVILVRFFNTVGPRQTGRYGMVIPRFVAAALRDESLIIHGTGQQTRCFVHVRDVVEGLLALTESRDAPGRVYNIGSNEEITIEDLADKIVAMTASKSKKRKISYEEAYGEPFDDMMRRVPCLDRIRETVGWQPRINLENTLRSIIDHTRKRDLSVFGAAQK